MMKLGDILICIKEFRDIVVGEKYYIKKILIGLDDIIIYRVDKYFFVDKDDTFNEYLFEYFITLSKHRENLLNDLLN